MFMFEEVRLKDKGQTLRRVNDAQQYKYTSHLHFEHEDEDPRTKNSSRIDIFSTVFIKKLRSFESIVAVIWLR